MISRPISRSSGLQGDAIPLVAQIIGVVDVYDALTTRRPYRAALPQTDACAMLREEVARGWRRRELVDALVTMVESGRLEASEAVGATIGLAR
jgi:putative two-component system response regulator